MPNDNINISPDKQIQVVPVEYVDKRFDNFEKKFDNFEKKLEIMSSAMIDLARTEEKIMVLEKERRQLEERLNAQAKRIDDLNDISRENSRVTGNFTKLSWLVIAAIVGLSAKIVFLS